MAWQLPMRSRARQPTNGRRARPARHMNDQQPASISLDPAVERPLECVPCGAPIETGQGATRRRSGSTTTRCNAGGRRAGRAPGVVAAITRQVRRQMTKIVNAVKPLHAARSGQLPDLGSEVSAPVKPSQDDIVLRVDVHSVDRLLDRDGSPLIGPRIHPDVARAIRADAAAYPKGSRFQIRVGVPARRPGPCPRGAARPSEPFSRGIRGRRIRAARWPPKVAGPF
jgi:hypothetical protein